MNQTEKKFMIIAIIFAVLNPVIGHLFYFGTYISLSLFFIFIALFKDTRMKMAELVMKYKKISII